MDINTVKIGCDPELFVKKDGKYVTGHGLIKGDKANPFKVEAGAVQVDGMALEFNIDPVEDVDGFITNISTVMDQLQKMVPGYTLHADPVAKFGKKYLSTMPEEALELGCEPDFNAWEDGRANDRPDGDVDFRTGGGHVHIGWTEGMDIDDLGHREACIMLVKELDFYLGVPSMFWDREDGRRAMYGKAGAFRIKPYGVEYRSLSNAWLRDKETMKAVFRNTKLAFQNLMDGVSLVQEYGDISARAINRNDRNLGQGILKTCLHGMPFRELRTVGA